MFSALNWDNNISLSNNERHKKLKDFLAQDGYTLISAQKEWGNYIFLKNDVRVEIKYKKEYGEPKKSFDYRFVFNTSKIETILDKRIRTPIFLQTDWFHCDEMCMFLYYQENFFEKVELLRQRG